MFIARENRAGISAVKQNWQAFRRQKIYHNLLGGKPTKFAEYGIKCLKNYLALAASNEHLKVRAVTKYTLRYLQVGLHVMDPPSEHLIFTHWVLKPAPNRKPILGDVYHDFWRHSLVTGRTLQAPLQGGLLFAFGHSTWPSLWLTSPHVNFWINTA